MDSWEIKVLYLGKIKSGIAASWPSSMPPLPENITLDSPILGFLLRSGDRKIIVDTGISEKFIIDGKGWGGYPAEGGRPYVEKALKKEGLTAQDIDTVIYTHLHNDHAANCTLFNRARIIFQRDEWLNLLSPIPLQIVRKDYDPDLIDELKSMNPLIVDGDIEVAGGIKLYKTPGHTLGSQSVAVTTRKGVVVLIGDLCTRYHYAFPQLGEVIDMEGNKHSLPKAPPLLGPAVASNLIYDSFSFYSSIFKVKAIASQDKPGFLIPGHEPSLVWQGIGES